MQSILACASPKIPAGREKSWCIPVEQVPEAGFTCTRELTDHPELFSCEKIAPNQQRQPQQQPNRQRNQQSEL
jgi:hypothetical protein